MRNDLLIYHIDRSSIKKALEIRDRDIQNPLSGSLRRPGNMGSDDGVTGFFERIISSDRLGGDDVKPCRIYFAGRERICEVLLHHQLSAAVIDQNKVIVQLDGNRQDLPKTRLVGREYCITEREQIYPLYGISLQRVDYCIIWRDSNFESSQWKEPLKRNKEIIKNMTGYNLYTESNSKDALRLVYRKRFNKIIIITNVGQNLEGKKYVDKVRQILGFNVAALFFSDDMKHLDWLKDYTNGLFCMDDYTIKKYIFNYDEDGYNDIRNNVRDFYCVELQEPQNAFDYPLFEKYKDNAEFLGDLELGEYDDFDGI